MQNNFIQLLEPVNLSLFNDYCNCIILWLALFCLITIGKLSFSLIYTNIFDQTEPTINSKKENPIIEELPGLPFILLHSLCWFVSKNYISKILFMYWGPLYIVTAFLVLSKQNINWKKIATSSSIACKSFYVLFVGLFLHLQYSMPIYCYSVWIMNDQVNLAWFKNNADRTRRLFEDYFVFRIGYPLFLFLPFFDETFYCRKLCMSISILLLGFWLGGIYRLIKKGIFFVQPKIEGFGRDIVYS